MKLFSSKSKRAAPKKSTSVKRDTRAVQKKPASLDYDVYTDTHATPGETASVDYDVYTDTQEPENELGNIRMVSRRPKPETRDSRNIPRNNVSSKAKPANASRKAKPKKAKKKVGHKVLLSVFFLILISAVVVLGIWIFINTTPVQPEHTPQPVVSTEEPDDSEPDDQDPPESSPTDEFIKVAASEIIDISVPLGDVVTIDDFLEDVSDRSVIASAVFINEPDSFTIGAQAVEIALEDSYGNRETVYATFTVLNNDIPPTIEGARPIDAMKSGNIVYRQGVSAFDAFGRPLEFEVDSSDVNLDELGEYRITYSTSDIYGLSTEVEVSVFIVDIDPEWVNERVDRVFEEIFTGEMTQVEEARAIFTWIKANITFMPMASAPQSAYEGAYRAFQDRRGGCTIFSALSDVMLNRAGIPTLRIERVSEAPTRHRWNLINPDGLGWYHFDAFPIRLGGPRDELYLFTASHAANFTRQMGAVENGVAMYYVYDETLYPDIVYDCNEVCAC